MIHLCYFLVKLSLCLPNSIIYDTFMLFNNKYYYKFTK